MSRAASLRSLVLPLSLLAACSPGAVDVEVEQLDVAHAGISGDIPVGTVLRTTADLNFRSGPSTSHGILDVLASGTLVTVKTVAPESGFYQVEHDAIVGWSSGKYLEIAGPPDTISGQDDLFTFHATTLALDVAVFVPEAAKNASEIDVLLYLHGHNVCSPVAKKPPGSFVTDAPFELDGIVAESQRPIVLVLPFLDWEHLSANGMAFGGKKHKLGIPENLNGVMAEVLIRIGQQHATEPPSISSLILAGHSRAYDVLNPLAAAHADEQMSKGALAKLSRVWAFDATYACSPLSAWTSWLASKPSLAIDVSYIAGSGTSACGKSFAALQDGSDGRLSVHVTTASHCAVPAKSLPALLAALP